MIKTQFHENRRFFYEEHVNFSFRTSLEYQISPGIKCKFDLLKNNLERLRIKGRNAIDLGCSGNSILMSLKGINQKSFLDIAFTPLRQYIRKVDRISIRDKDFHFNHPVCAALTHLPYRMNSFDLIFALDVLEHVKNDVHAIKEIHGIMKKESILIITVPHGIKFYSTQDKLIGHYRRYEIRDLILAFNKKGFQIVKVFGIYGRLMAISGIQSRHAKEVEESILKLRNIYSNNKLFKCFWDVIVRILSTMMKWDARFTPLKKMRNIGLILIKMH
ncbi:MAG: class I SAM-dependent methyltransferase [Promethearchaeota archaeon]